MALLGASLTMASIAVLPVLLASASTTRSSTRRAWRRRAVTRSAPRASRSPTIATAGARHRRRLPRAAALAGADGARLRVLLVAGIAIAFFLALSAGTAALAATARRRGGGGSAGRLGARRGRARRRAGGARRARRSARSGALGGRVRERDAAQRARAPAARAPDRARDRARRAGGRLADARSSSDLRELVPQDLRGARDLDALQKATGRGGRDRRRGRERRPHRPEGRGVDARLPGGAAQGVRLLVEERLRRRPSCARRCRCPTSSGPRTRRRTRRASAGCSTPFPPTSRRPSSPPTARPRRSRSASS